MNVHVFYGHGNGGRVRERLAKRKQWILFNLIQLIYYVEDVFMEREGTV